MSSSDDAFKAYVAQFEAEIANKTNFIGNSAFSDYEELLWAGIPSGGNPLVVRLRGGLINLDPSPTTAKILNISEIICDDGKKHYFYFPLVSEAPNHIMWRIINKMLSYEWDSNAKEKIYLYEKEPEFNLVLKNGLPKDDPQYKMNKGWVGQESFVINCIPKNPDLYEICKNKKHTMLLSKSVKTVVNPVTNTTITYIARGVPYYGFYTFLMKSIVKFYGDWNNYDIKIVKTGNTSPYIINNVSRQPELLTPDLLKYVNDKPLSEEEASWEMYDIKKLFAYSSHHKILKYLGKTIKSIDAKLKTNFYMELLKLVEEEKKQGFGEKTTTTATTVNEPEKPTVTQQVETERVTRRAPASAPVNPSIQYPEGWDKLTEAEKKLIVEFKEIDPIKKQWQITYDSSIPASSLLECALCGTASPDSFNYCPGCGRKFS